MSEHTPEPWAVDEEDALIRTNRNGSGEQDYICMLADQSNDFGESWDTMEFCGSNRNGEIKANARRIVACVNACAGMADPAAEIARLRDDNDELDEVCTKRQLEIYKLEAEIAKLRTENARLREAIRMVVEVVEHEDVAEWRIDQAFANARAALAEKGE